MTGGAGEYSYKWTINGKGAETTETYTVPADANTGDAIKVVVTDEEGNTAEDVVYVGGFTILKVEPTTAMDGLGTGYKYIRAYFSSALTSLAPEDIVIRDKDTEQLYSIDTVKLSSDGTYADITLFGSVQEGGTTFLLPQTIYVMTVTNNELSDSYEFELPDIKSNRLVTKADISKGKITFDGTAYEVGDVYSDNLGSLVGRYVTVGVNSDAEIEKLSVKDANVVYGVMKFTDGDGGAGTVTAKDYFQDAVTKTKYYWTTTNTQRIFPSTSINVVTGQAQAPIEGDTYYYAKLVLNPDDTVATAVLDPNTTDANGGWTDSIRVADVEGTIVTETSKASLDFDGYTLEKDGAYVTTADLEVDDIIYYDSTAGTKFAEVYSVIADGEPSDITSTSISIGGVAYKWYDSNSALPTAKYYDADNDAFVEFDGVTAKGNVAAQKKLAGYDATLGVTAYLDRLGNIAYIDGIDAESAVTTDTWYVTTSAGSGYTQALASYLKFKVSDGTEQTIEIPVSQLKKFNGVDIKKVEGQAAGPDDGSEYEFTFTAKAATDNEAFGAAIQAKNLIESGVLVKITRDADNKIIGVSFPDGYRSGAGAADIYDYIDEIDGGDKALKPGVSKVVTFLGTKAKLTDSTVIWVYTTNDDGDITVSKETFGDYTKTTNKVSELNAAAIGPFVLVNGSEVTDILLRETLDADDKSDTFAAGDTNDTEGIVLSITQKKNSDGTANYNSAVKILEIDGSEVTYEALDESALAPANKDVYISLKLDKATGDASKVTDNTWEDTTYVDLSASSSKELKTLNGKTVKIDTANQVLKKTAAGYEAITMKQIVASTKQLKVSWHDQYYNVEDDVHYADFLVVEEEANNTNAAAAAQATARDAIELANTAYTALLAGTVTMADYEAADATADAWIDKWQVLSGTTTTVTDTALGFTAAAGYSGNEYTTFAGNATAYATAKNNIDTVAATATLTLDVALTTGENLDDWATAVEAVWTASSAAGAAVVGYTPTYAMATGETLASTVNADTNKIEFTVSDSGYTKTWTLAVTDLSDAAAAEAEIDDFDVTAITLGANVTSEADAKAAIKTAIEGQLTAAGITGCTVAVTVVDGTIGTAGGELTATATITKAGYTGTKTGIEVTNPAA